MHIATIADAQIVSILEGPGSGKFNQYVHDTADDPETTKRRIGTFQTDTSQILERLTAQGRVVKIQSGCDVEDVFARLQEALQDGDVELKPRAGLVYDISPFETTM
jgi:ABC-type Na+ transport system ATPase subunit NatA